MNREEVNLFLEPGHIMQMCYHDEDCDSSDASASILTWTFDGNEKAHLHDMLMRGCNVDGALLSFSEPFVALYVNTVDFPANCWCKATRLPPYRSSTEHLVFSERTWTRPELKACILSWGFAVTPRRQR